ncbi:helix-turn-helix domain-containing protein [Azospirillum sp. SYSU D00513]|uniref:helix-turn-helix domain-containing protein n=1 Tax=Azospirillum sp. SYSU D00513 TaxID=2812561 RepID=UPI001A95FC6B|nr:helix-turn-helix domain-containing protein [Azospirillum sp. SYSU D00513]
MDLIARSPQQIGNALRRFRTERSLRQADLGAMARLQQATVSKLEGGNPEARLQTLADVLAALDLELVIRPRTKADPADIEDLF